MSIRVGTDEWVSEFEERSRRSSSLAGRVKKGFDRVPGPGRLGAFVVVAALIPAMTNDGYLIRVGFDTLLFVLLGLGLNVAVGWGGLLDLGYVAFYGFGAFAYGILSSAQFHVHLPTVASIPVIVAATAILGFLVGLPSRRLVGDYLAIVTLFFGQIFLTVVINGNSIGGVNFTNGSNGIAGLDPFSFAGHRLPSSNLKGYFYVALIAFVVVLGVLHLVNQSRWGRAWRALREDPLAAELMSMPVNRLKLLAFAFGAGTAGLTGTIFAALNTGVFPQSFALPLLITIYAMVILGGAGSQTGVVVGAVAVNVLLEVLRSSDHARWLFYGLVLLTLLVKLRPWRRLAIVLGGTVGLGFAVHAAVGAISHAAISGAPQGTDAVARVVDHWVVIPDVIGNGAAFTYVGLICALLALTRLQGVRRLLFMIPTLYLGSFVWENVLATKPEATRFVLLGAILVGTMAARPEGVFGEKRVEII